MTAQPPPGEYWQHPYYSAVDHQLDPLMEVIRSATTDPHWGWGATDLRGALDAVRTALDQLERELLPAPIDTSEIERAGLQPGPVHHHAGDGDGSWCVRVGPPGAARLLWHIAYVPRREHEATRRRVSGPRGWVRSAWGDDEAAWAIVYKVFDHEESPLTEPWINGTTPTP